MSLRRVVTLSPDSPNDGGQPAGGAVERVPGFPEVALRLVPSGGRASALPELDLSWWQSDAYDPYALDRLLGDAAEGPLQPFVVRAADRPQMDSQLPLLLTRLQSRLPRRNHASATPAFDRLLSAHRRMHDLRLPLVRADFVHALDVWQWVVRLDEKAGADLQAAALLHDVERLASEPIRRFEHLAPDYQTFKDAHARAGARMAKQLLESIGWERSGIDRVVTLVAGHESPDSDPELALLNDADGLSFFSVNSAGYLDWFGEPQARRKIAWTLGRLSSSARRRVLRLRMRPDVEALVRSIDRSVAQSIVRDHDEAHGSVPERESG